jgi:dolichyl-phosphate-mannose-protein mannosyltransferase
MRKKVYALAVIAVISFAVHFAWYGNPSSVVFDEVHFAKFVSSYTSGEYYFDIHPPLGKLLIAGFAAPFSPRILDSQAVIDSPFEGNGYLALRFLPTLSGVLIPIIIFFILLQLKLSLKSSFFGSLLFCFDNALLVQTRSIFLDGFLLLFLLSSFLFYLRFRESGSWKDFVSSFFFCALAVSIKWTGLSALALPFVWEFFDVLRKPVLTAWMRLGCLTLTGMSIVIVMYFMVFAIHFALLPKTGSGDAFMSPYFQKTLKGNPWQSHQEIAEENLLGKFVELNERMYTANRDLKASHPYSSQWYTWPMEVRPIYYWVKDSSRIYLIGNPVIWWGAALGIVFLLFSLFTQRRRHSQITTVLLGAWALNFFPFIFIGRAMFLYHYLAAFSFSLILLVYLLSGTKRYILWLSLLTIGAVILFFWFAPLSYGLPLDDKALKLRQWFPTWI